MFLLHTGANKAGEVGTLKYIFEKQNDMRCFIDRDMNLTDDPNSTMSEALETCRYAVAVISGAFLEKPSPCAELQYAFKKLLWLRDHGYWTSLLVVLLDVSVEDYKTAYKSTGEQLPPIHHEIQMLQYGQGKGSYIYWTEACQRLMSDIAAEDEKRAAQSRWTELLAMDHDEDPYPSAKGIYELHRNETGCCEPGTFTERKELVAG